MSLSEGKSVVSSSDISSSKDFSVCIDHFITLVPVYIPGWLNIKADVSQASPVQI